MSVKLLHGLNDFKQAIAANNLVVVDFYTDWCNPCKQIAPKIDTLAASETNVEFYKINVDHASDVATFANISAMPTFHFYRKSSLLDKVIGANLSTIKSKVASLQ